MKQLIKRILKLVPFNFTKNQKYDAQTKTILKKHLQPNSNAIDVGAHKGEILDLFLRYAPQGKHMAFEPIPEMAKVLENNYKSVKVFNCALANHKGSTSFNWVKSNPAYSGLKKRQYVSEEIIEKIEVDVQILDECVPVDQPIHLIKIDVEGAELGVLRGAEQTIKRCKPLLIFEHGKGASEYYQTTPEAVFDFLDSCGMKISLLSDFIKTKPALTKPEFINQYNQKLNYYFIAHA